MARRGMCLQGGSGGVFRILEGRLETKGTYNE